MNVLGRMRIGIRVVIKESAFDCCGGKNKMKAIVKFSSAAHKLQTAAFP